MGANGFRKFKRSFRDEWDERRERRRTPRHRPSKEGNAIYAREKTDEPQRDRKDYD